MDNLTIREATAADIPAIVALLVDDDLGKLRESDGATLDPGYRDAFDAMAEDRNCMLMVAVLGERIIGTFQLNVLPSLSQKGAWRGQIEAVRVAADLRGAGLGKQMMDWAIDACRARGCRLVQLTTDVARQDAHRFYERLGFVASHRGYKLKI